MRSRYWGDGERDRQTLPLPLRVYQNAVSVILNEVKNLYTFYKLLICLHLQILRVAQNDKKMI